MALVVSLFFVDCADVPLQGACCSKRARAMHALVIALLVVDRPYVCLQRADLPKRAPAMRALVVFALLVDGANMPSAITFTAEGLSAVLACTIGVHVRMRTPARFLGFAHVRVRGSGWGGSEALVCPCFPASF